jgi:hypothetical protein
MGVTMDKFINKAEIMLKSMTELAEEWEQLKSEDHDKLAENYPFEKSFDEIVIDVKSWVNQLKENK